MKSPFPFSWNFSAISSTSIRLDLGGGICWWFLGYDNGMLRLCASWDPGKSRNGPRKSSPLVWGPMRVGKPAFLIGKRKTPKTSQRTRGRFTWRQTQDWAEHLLKEIGWDRQLQRPLHFFFFQLVDILMNFPPGSFKLPGHRPHQHP